MCLYVYVFLAKLSHIKQLADSIVSIQYLSLRNIIVSESYQSTNICTQIFSVLNYLKHDHARYLSCM